MARIERDGRLVTTAAVCIRDNRFYLARRGPSGAQAGRWEFPGGKCDQDTDEVACLQRELREELGIESTIGPVLGEVPFEHKGTAYLLVARETSFHTNPVLVDAHTEDGWFTRDEMLALDLADSDRLLIDSMLASGRIGV